MGRHEPTWDKETGMHTCCGSTHSYHKNSCHVRRQFVTPGRISDPEYIRVQYQKSRGLSSQQTAENLGLALEHVNELWI